MFFFHIRPNNDQIDLNYPKRTAKKYHFEIDLPELMLNTILLTPTTEVRIPRAISNSSTPTIERRTGPTAPDAVTVK